MKLFLRTQTDTGELWNFVNFVDIPADFLLIITLFFIFCYGNWRWTNFHLRPSIISHNTVWATLQMIRISGYASNYVQVLDITFHSMPPIRLYAWSSSDGVTLEMDGIFYSTFCSNLFECMNNEESRAAVYWTLYLWARCIRKCNSWMIEKPIKVVIKLQMSPFSVFLPFNMGSGTRCSHQLCASLWRTHTSQYDTEHISQSNSSPSRRWNTWWDPSFSITPREDTYSFKPGGRERF